MGTSHNHHQHSNVIQLADFAAHRAARKTAIQPPHPSTTRRETRAAASHTGRRIHAAATDASQPIHMAPTLRVTHRFETDTAGGRVPTGLRISGRLADVCAELDRLAALETLVEAHPASPSRRA